MTIFGLKSDLLLQSLAGGYETIVRSMPDLKADAAS